jgi:hypothetical protein
MFVEIWFIQIDWDLEQIEFTFQITIQKITILQTMKLESPELRTRSLPTEPSVTNHNRQFWTNPKRRASTPKKTKPVATFFFCLDTFAKKNDSELFAIGRCRSFNPQIWPKPVSSIPESTIAFDVSFVCKFSFSIWKFLVHRNSFTWV